MIFAAAVCVMHTAAARCAFAQSLTISGTPAVNVNSAQFSGGLQPATDNTSTYSIITSAPDQKLLARLGCSLPSGITVTIQVSGATSTGSRPLTTTDVEVLGPIPTASTSNGMITYTLNATVAAGPLATVPCGITFTLVQGP
jgi:hypothetical protein